jgi:Holliday junction resolvase-like predicted endonuclease
MRLLGYEVEGEVHTDKGRIDVVLKKADSVVIVEIKYGREEGAGKLVEEGLRQIREKKYYEKYIGITPSLLAIGFGKDKEIECRFDKVN